jgi:hypothetical protein
VHKRYSNENDGSGFVEAWINGEQVTFETCDCTRLVTQTMHSSHDGLGFYLISYRARGVFDTFDMYYDSVRIGTTREIVELD